MPAKNRQHYTGSYAARAKAVRAAAYADPNTQCWRCGRTLKAHGPTVKWDAGHIRDGDPTSPLAPEASSCNRSAGATAGNLRRTATIATTREW